MIRIITDSTCDLTPQEAQALGITVIPLLVHFGNEEFRDGVDLTQEAFYEKLAGVETLPTTSQCSPEVFRGAFQQAVDEGDQVVGLFLSALLSGTYQAALLGSQMVEGGEIRLVNTQAASLSLNLMVRIAAALRDQGKSALEIAQEMESLARRVRLIAVLDTLKYLKMGGRISGTTALIGGVLGVIPIIGIEGGQVVTLGKTRGRKAAYRKVEELVQKCPADPRYPVVFGHSNAPALASDLAVTLCDEVCLQNAVYGGIGTVIGTHVGPGACGIAYISKG